MTGKIPHLKVVVAVTACAILGFGIVSAYVLGWSTDEVTKGSVIGSWQNVALLAFGFWLGSSSGGKISGKIKDDAPTDVTVVNPPDNPVPTMEGTT